MIASFQILTRACSGTRAAPASMAKFSASVRFLAMVRNRSEVKSGHRTGSHGAEDAKNPDASVAGPARDDCIVFAVLNVFATRGTRF